MHRIKSRLSTFVLDLRAGFWFIPGLVVLACLALAAILIEVDSRVGFEALRKWPRLFGAGSDGSRSMLSAVATSMITVAGVTFSITMVALAQTSNQYSPRLLRTFMADRSTKLVLGIFVGIFAYCLVVLRTITSSDQEVEFIPRISVFTGGVLGLVSIAFLVYFIHHISASLQPSNILAGVAAETMAAVDHLFPEPLGSGAGEREISRIEAELEDMHWEQIPAAADGYLQGVNTSDLLAFAETNRLVVRMEVPVGGFLVECAPLVSVSCEDGRPTEQFAGDLRAMLPVGMHRTIEQDAPYGLEQLADVAAKALSPSMNDARTAITCIHYLTAVFCRVAGRQIETPYRYGSDHRVRVIAKGPCFASMAMTAFDPVLRNAGNRRDVFEAVLQSLTTLASRVSTPERLWVLTAWLERVQAGILREVLDPGNRDELLSTASALEGRLRAG